MVEQLTLNQRVHGSSPCAPTNPLPNCSSRAVVRSAMRSGPPPSGRSNACSAGRERGRMGRYRFPDCAHHADRLDAGRVAGRSRLPISVAGSGGGSSRASRTPSISAARCACRFALTDGEADAHIRDMSENTAAFSVRRCTRILRRRRQCTSHARRSRACRYSTCRGTGCSLVGGHFANWELFEVALANLGLGVVKVLAIRN